MAPRKAALRRHTPEPPPARVPRADDALLAAYRQAEKANRAYGAALTRFLAARGPTEAQAWMQACIAGARPALGPWCLEILFHLATSRELRFSELAQRLAGVSSRTLTDKLADLQRAGLVDKRVDLDGTRVRIRYALTPHGLAAALHCGPFMSCMNGSGGFDRA